MSEFGTPIQSNQWNCMSSPAWFLCQPPLDPFAPPQPIPGRDGRRSVLRLKDIQLGIPPLTSAVSRGRSTRRDHNLLAIRLSTARGRSAASPDCYRQSSPGCRTAADAGTRGFLRDSQRAHGDEYGENYDDLFDSSRAENISKGDPRMGGIAAPRISPPDDEGLYDSMPDHLYPPGSPISPDQVSARSSDRIRALQASLGGDFLTSRHGKAPPIKAPYYASGALLTGADDSMNVSATPLLMVS